MYIRISLSRYHKRGNVSKRGCESVHRGNTQGTKTWGYSILVLVQINKCLNIIKHVLYYKFRQ